MDMMESLMKTESIPTELQRFVQDRVEGNPFYIEELINSLIESETLVSDSSGWKIAKSISESVISSTIHGVISGRLDRLEKETKRILQEASVIGRAFLYDILKQITLLKDNIDTCLSGLERIDLIKARTIQPDLEYIFKHALTQEVVYNGLLKQERQVIHKRIGHVIEQLFTNRLPEFYETLAFHFAKGKSIQKAVEYLMKSGEKSLRKYSVEESHQYYKEAYNLLLEKQDKTKEDEIFIIDLLLKWAYVFYFRGDFKGFTDVLSVNVDRAESLDDNARVGMFYAWMGLMLWERERYRDSYQYLHKSLELGEKIDNKQVIGYACCWLASTYAELGLPEDEAIGFGKRGEAIAEILESDHYLYFKSLLGIGINYWFRGEIKKVYEVAKRLLDYGNEHHNPRSLAVGHFCTALGHFTAGNLPSSVECCQKAIEVSVDPFYSQVPRCFAGASYVMNGQFQEAEAALEEVLAYSQQFGCDVLTTAAQLFLGVVSISKGKFGQGLNMIEDVRQSCWKNERRFYAVVSEYVLGKVYLQIVEGAGPMSLSTIVKNFGFLIKNVPLADKKAQFHFNKAIETAKDIGAKGFLGLSYLDLGLLHKAKKRKDRAKKSISEAVKLFKDCEADVYLKQANEALESLQ
jgi:tetratricopeptide (TPR) repeat protein